MRDWNVLTEDLETVGTPEDIDPDHDPTNGRWFEAQVADALDGWGYRTARNESHLGIETDVIARRDELRGEPDNFLSSSVKTGTKRPSSVTPTAAATRLVMNLQTNLKQSHLEPLEAAGCITRNGDQLAAGPTHGWHSRLSRYSL